MKSCNANQLLAQGLVKLSLQSVNELADYLNGYLDLLDKWNRVYNLTAIRSREERVVKHLLDSLAVAAYLQPGALLDVGSGAGLPGIPLALVDHTRPVTLLDSSQKKCRFLQQVKTELGLDNVEVICTRAQAFAPATKFPQIICRAYTSLVDFTQTTNHLLTAQGVWLAMKGAHPLAELEQIRTVEIIADSVILSVPFLDAERHLVTLRRLPERAEQV